MTIKVQVCPVIISQITMFGPWKHVDSIPYLLGCYIVTRHTPPCALPDLDESVTKQVTSYAFVSIFVSVRILRSKPPRSTGSLSLSGE